jgi:ribonuclease HI
VAAAAPDPSSEIVVKGETPCTQPALDLVVDHNGDESLDEADSDSEDDDEENSSDNNFPNDHSNLEQPLAIQPHIDQHLDNRSSTRERPRDNGAPAAGFYLRDKAESIQLPHPRASPRDVFAHDSDDHPWRQTGESSKQSRMVRHGNPYEILIYTSAFLFGSSARKDARAACVFLTTIGRDETLHSRCKGLLLEKTGRDGKASQGYSQKRADLRAVVAALEYQTWVSEGWKKVNIATKSSYVYNGMTRFVGKWKSDAWCANSRRGPSEVLNADLWARALDLVNEQAYHGCEVQFWLVTGEDALEVEAAALVKAKMSHAPPKVYQSLGNVDIT